MNQVPVIPESAPFTPEQRAYLNGFLAGLFSRAPQSVASPAAPTPATLAPLAVLYGSQTGNAENLAKRIAKEAGKHGFAPVVHDLAKYQPAQLAGEKHVLIITSTFGDGEPPDNAKPFWESLTSEAAPKLPETRFSVCALGDMNYPKFCQFGKDLDTRLEKLGATRVQPCQDCDADFEAPFTQWLASVVPALAGPAAVPDSTSSAPAVIPGSASKAEEPVGYSKKNPFPSRLLVNRRLNGDKSSKDVRHFELSLDGSGLTYEVGDALAVKPVNNPVLVDELLTALGFDGEEEIAGPEGKPMPLRLALLNQYDITRIPQPLLAAVAGRSGNAELQKIAAPTANGDLTKFLHGRDILDVLTAFPQVKFSPAEFAGFLRKLPPRLYSISSSPKAHPGQVHLTVSAVRYESLGRVRKGVCSTFLADRVGPETPVPVYVHHNKAFRPPAPDLPLIMVGPGTGIAPFRAFLEERRAIGAKGRNWLFFGDQHAASDFLYREEVETFLRDDTLAQVDLAWSRDQTDKVYVQHRMIENAHELYAWLEEGAGFYVCGDANRMAKDVDAALHKVIETAGGKSAAGAVEYVKRLKAEKRYCRDVY